MTVPSSHAAAPDVREMGWPIATFVTFGLASAALLAAFMPPPLTSVPVIVTAPLLASLAGRVVAVSIPRAEGDLATGRVPWSRWQPDLGLLPLDYVSCGSGPCQPSWSTAWDAWRCGIGPFDWRLHREHANTTLHGPIDCGPPAGPWNNGTTPPVEYRLSADRRVVEYRCALAPWSDALAPAEHRAFRLLPPDEATPTPRPETWPYSDQRLVFVGAWSALAMLVGAATWATLAMLASAGTRRSTSSAYAGAAARLRWRLATAFALSSIMVVAGARTIVPFRLSRRDAPHRLPALPAMAGPSCTLEGQSHNDAPVALPVGTYDPSSELE
ncbi:MAG: hypothetical protein Q7V43_21990 [Myxococcales bacterium]|nr:hypothetical protein [Myxococcales bacterium]